MTADQIGPNKETSVVKEDETVTLSCTYDTSSRYITLYWYRQYPNKEPQYLMWKDARAYSNAGTPADRRFQATTSETSTELTYYWCNSVRFSSLLLCSKSWSPVIQSLCEAVQKLKCIFHIDLKPYQTHNL